MVWMAPLDSRVVGDSGIDGLRPRTLQSEGPRSRSRQVTCSATGTLNGSAAAPRRRCPVVKGAASVREARVGPGGSAHRCAPVACPLQFHGRELDIAALGEQLPVRRVHDLCDGCMATHDGRGCGLDASRPGFHRHSRNRPSKLARIWRSALDKPQTKGTQVPDSGSETLLRARIRAGGQGQNRTADTTIFSRVLYQLSYLTRCRTTSSSDTLPTSKRESLAPADGDARPRPGIWLARASVRGART